VVRDLDGKHISIPADTPDEMLKERNWTPVGYPDKSTEQERNKAWAKDAMENGLIADLKHQIGPAAHEIAGALRTLDTSRPFPFTKEEIKNAKRILMEAGYGATEQEVEGRFSVPTAVVSKTQE